MIDGLKDEQRNAIIEVLSTNENVERVVLFGSRATETYSSTSDIDIALYGDGLTHTDQARLVGAVDELPYPHKVDLLIHKSIRNEKIRAEIDNRGVEWFNRRRARQDDWHETTLGECVVINTSTYSPKENWPLVNYLDTGNITENRIDAIQEIDVRTQKLPTRARRKVMPGDVVYSTVRPNQRHFGIVDGPPPNFLASTGFAVLRGLDGVAETEYIYWYLTQDDVVEYLHGIAENSTSAYPSIKPSDLEQLTLKLPPLPEQRRIAHILGTLDDKIELNRRMNETLEEMARAIFKDWFVDFGPVRAKIEGRDAYLPEEIWRLFPDRLVESELGEVPEGWVVRALGDVMELRYGKSLTAKKRRSGNVPVYGSNGQIGWHDEVLVKGPGIVVGRKGNPGIVKWAHSDFFPIDTTFYAAPKLEPQSLEFLFFALEEQDLPSVAADSAVPGLNRNLAYMNEQALPTGALLGKFTQIVSAMFANRRELEAETMELTDLRDEMLPKLVAGDIDLTACEPGVTIHGN